jgi:peptide/nickel transport system substrate-binding protein
LRRIVSLVAMFMVLFALAAPGVNAQEDRVTLIIGLTQPWETLNPTVGFTVSEFEYYNVQFASLVGKAAPDFAAEPALVESWEENQAGLNYTYTLREGLLWSDGTPITAEDAVWNINTSRDQEWPNYISTVTNLSAEVIDERTFTVTSSVPDPKLPGIEIYMVPKHIWEPVATDGEAVTTYEALDGVGSGPFTLSEYQSEEFLRMEANPNYWAGEPAVDEVIFRYFSNADAMVAALQQGEIQAAHDVPASSVEALEGDPNIEMVAGFQGGFDEIALNGGLAPETGHPALADIEFRRAVSMGIDKAAVVEDLWFGLATPATTISVGADLKWVPEIPEADLIEYDPARAIATLDAAGYVDTDGDGIRNMPDGGENIVLNHAVNTDSDLAPSIGELFTGWMNVIGIGVELSSYDQDQLFTVIVEGTYDSFYWGWTPFVDPDPMLSYFTEAEIGNWNDANWSNPRYEELYLLQKQEVDPDARLAIVHEMLTVFYNDAVYFPLYYSPDLQAYRTDGFEGWVRQPAEVGPVMFSNSSPSYALLTPVGAAAAPDDTTAETTDDGAAGGTTETTTAGTEAGDTDTTDTEPAEEDEEGGSNLLWIFVGVAVLAGLVGVMMSKRKKSADDRE